METQNITIFQQHRHLDQNVTRSLLLSLKNLFTPFLLTEKPVMVEIFKIEKTIQCKNCRILS